MAIVTPLPWSARQSTPNRRFHGIDLGRVLTGITVDFVANQASGGAGGHGGAGSEGFGGNGGNGGGGKVGGDGFTGTGGNGGNGGTGGRGVGGGIWSAASSTLTIDPRLGAKKGSKQSKARDTITLNLANFGVGGAGGAAGNGGGGKGGLPGGTAGLAFPGKPGAPAVGGSGIGGGLYQSTSSAVTIANTDITGNTASNRDNDVSIANAVVVESF